MNKEKAQKNTEVSSKGKVLSGVVVSDKMKDTIVVEVQRFVKHAKYKKYHKVHKKYKVHDAGNTRKVGEKVEIRETKPISKTKHFTVVESYKDASSSSTL